MNKEQEDLLLILKCALWQDVRYASGIDKPCWDKIYKLAYEQCVVGNGADSFNVLSSEHRDMDGKLRWLGYVIKQEQKNRLQNESIGKLFRTLKGLGLSPVLMKGQAFAANYPFPLHRQCGDIDVYFKKHDDCHKAVAWAERKDKAAAESSYNKRERKHFCFFMDGNEIELHYHLCLFENEELQKRLQRIIDDEFDNNEPCFADIGGERIEMIPPTLSVLHQIIHISRHLLEAGVGLRQLCDLALYLDKFHSVIDKERLNAYLNELQLVTIAGSIGYILVDNLGLEEGRLPFKKNKQYADFLLQEIFEGGNFGKKNVKYRENCHGLKRKLQSVIYFFRRCWTYKPLMPKEARSYFLNKNSLNIKLMTKHHY